MNYLSKPIQVFRGDYIESTHDVHIAIVTAKNELIAYFGDPYRLTFGRSSMKPFQALPVVESGAIDTFDITEKELSLFCASHNGESFHRKSVGDVLEKLNLKEMHLQCGTHIPKDIDSYNKLIKCGGELTPLFSNCSGKHAGMLAGCLKQKMSLNTYRDLEHPYQQNIINTIANVAGYDKQKIATSIDGCGVPVHRLPLYHLALAFGRLAKPNDWVEGSNVRKDSLLRVRNAMTQYPEMIAGTDRFDTNLMEVFGDQIVAKGGAEGVHCFGDKEKGIGVALKVEDGNDRGRSGASVEVLKQLSIGNNQIWYDLRKHSSTVSNARKEKVGKIKFSFQLNFM